MLPVRAAGAAMDALGDKNLPLTQVAATYVLIFILNALIMTYYGWSFQAKWYTYLVIAVVNSMAACSLVEAMKYSSVTSMGLLSCSGVLLSIPLSYFFLNARFSPLHYVGALSLIAGIVLLLLTDKSKDTSKSKTIWGDLLLIGSSCLYTIDSILIEKLLKETMPIYELYTVVSGYSFCFACIALTLAGEYKHIIPSSAKIGLLQSGASATQFFAYAVMPIILTWSGSTVGQLSLLSAAIWAVPVRILLLDGFGSTWWIFAIAVSLTVAGILFYIGGGDVYAKSQDPHPEMVEDDNEYAPCPDGL